MNVRAIGLVFPFLIAIALGLISIKLGQDTNGDMWNYHWYNAWSYLHGRLNYDIAPAGAHSYFNPYLDTIYFLSISHLHAKAHAFLFGFIQGLISYPIYYIVCNFLKEKKEIFLITILCSFGSIFFIGELGESMQDNTVALFVLCSLAFVLLAKGSLTLNKKLFHTAIASLLVSIATGLKLTAATYLISMGLMSVIFISVGFKDNLKVGLVFAIFAIMGLAISTGHWFYCLYQHFDSPIFPFYNNIFKSVYASTDPNATRHMFFFREKGIESIFYPFFFAENTSKIASAANNDIFVLYSPLICFILIPFCFITRAVKEGFNSVAKSDFFFISSFFFISYVIWQKEFGVYRYFIPTDLICPLVIYLSIDGIFKSFGVDKKILFIFITFLLVSSNFSKGVPTWGRGRLVTPYFSAETPSDVKNADVIFTFSYPSAWILPIIEPKGHVIGLGDMLFNYGTTEYWNLYNHFGIHNGSSQIAIFDKVRGPNFNEADEKLKRYNLKIDRNACKSFKLRISSYDSEQLYCPVIIK